MWPMKAASSNRNHVDLCRNSHCPTDPAPVVPQITPRIDHSLDFSAQSLYPVFHCSSSSCSINYQISILVTIWETFFLSLSRSFVVDPGREHFSLTLGQEWSKKRCSITERVSMLHQNLVMSSHETGLVILLKRQSNGSQHGLSPRWRVESISLSATQTFM